MMHDIKVSTLYKYLKVLDSGRLEINEVCEKLNFYNKSFVIDVYRRLKYMGFVRISSFSTDKIIVKKKYRRKRKKLVFFKLTDKGRKLLELLE